MHAVAGLVLRHAAGLLLPGRRGQAGGGVRHPRAVAQLRQVPRPPPPRGRRPRPRGARRRRRLPRRRGAAGQVLAGVLRRRRRRPPAEPLGHPGPGGVAGPELADAVVQEPAQLRVLELRVEEARHLLQPGPARLLRARAAAQGAARPRGGPRGRRDRAVRHRHVPGGPRQGRHRAGDRLRGQPRVQPRRGRRGAAVPGVPVRGPRGQGPHRLPAPHAHQVHRSGQVARLLIPSFWLSFAIVKTGRVQIDRYDDTCMFAYVISKADLNKCVFTFYLRMEICLCS
uniref:Uncharacterized protein n=1 Tax=Zea mays TaxID=4577 RepID=A0A804QGV4_MAIZE